jgi:heptaprenyl diphosphate synthase
MKRLEQFRSRRRDIYERLFSARALCIAGFLIMPALLFNPNTFLRILQFFLFWFLSWLSGKKNNPLITIVIILGIVFFNLLVPYGRVLFSIGVFKVSSGALIAGIHRAVTLEGLIMLSRVSIRRDLRIPGGFGELIGESFRIFALIMDSRHRITRKNLMGDIDALMIELSGDAPVTGQAEAATTAGEAAAAGEAAVASGEEIPEPYSSGPVPKKGTTVAGYIILALTVILSWLPLIFMALLLLKNNPL